jgi:hypothetical protein
VEGTAAIRRTDRGISGSIFAATAVTIVETGKGASLECEILRRVCHDTLDYVSVPGYPSAIETRSLPTLTRSVLPSMSLHPALHSPGSRTPAVVFCNDSRGL